MTWLIDWLLRCRAYSGPITVDGQGVRCHFVRGHGLVTGVTTHEADSPNGGTYRWYP